MSVIHKYELAIKHEQSIMTPAICELLHAGEQRGKLCLWAMVDAESPKVQMRVRVIGTGHPIHHSHGWRYIDTVIMHDGELVWHVFVMNRA